MYDNECDFSIVFMNNIISEECGYSRTCGVAMELIYDNLADRHFVNGGEHIRLLDNLYISALYDRSVLVGEDISTAKPKIVNAMIETLERNK